ncbi:MAG: hypothetical protein AAGA48_36465 [Myxococcota bacterium]
MPSRLRRRTPSRAPVARVVDVTRYFGPTTLQVMTERGSWCPKVDQVGVGWSRDRGTIEVGLDDGDLRPTLPWWLRTSSRATITLHGLSCVVGLPTVRRRGHWTLLRWPTRQARLAEVLNQAKQLPAMFEPLLKQPLSAEVCAVIKDYLLSAGDESLAVWFGDE